MGFRDSERHICRAISLEGGGSPGAWFLNSGIGFKGLVVQIPREQLLLVAITFCHC